MHGETAKVFDMRKMTNTLMGAALVAWCAGVAGCGAEDGGSKHTDSSADESADEATGQCQGTPMPDCPYFCGALVAIGGASVTDTCAFLSTRSDLCATMAGCEWVDGACQSQPCSGTTESSCRASGSNCSWVQDTDSSECEPPAVETCEELSNTQCATVRGCTLGSESPADDSEEQTGSDGSDSEEQTGSDGSDSEYDGLEDSPDSNEADRWGCLSECSSLWSSCSAFCNPFGDDAVYEDCANDCETGQSDCEEGCYTRYP